MAGKLCITKHYDYTQVHDSHAHQFSLSRIRFMIFIAAQVFFYVLVIVKKVKLLILVGFVRHTKLTLEERMST